MSDNTLTNLSGVARTNTLSHENIKSRVESFKRESPGTLNSALIAVAKDLGLSISTVQKYYYNCAHKRSPSTIPSSPRKAEVAMTKYRAKLILILLSSDPHEAIALLDEELIKKAAAYALKALL